MAGRVQRQQELTGGVVFPEVDGARSTSRFGREVVATALAAVDPVGAAAARRETTWRSGYLPHFRRIVGEGVASVMSAYNSVNGDWCGQNRSLLTDVLRGEWGFEGFVGDSQTDRAVGGKAATACFSCHEALKDSGYVFSELRP